MPNHFEVLPHVNRLIEREVPDVSLGIAEAIPSGIAERRAEQCICRSSVGDKSHVFISHYLRRISRVGKDRRVSLSVRGPAFVPISPLLTPLKLTRLVGVIAGFPHRLPALGPFVTTAHVSPAKIPTVSIGAELLPR